MTQFTLLLSRLVNQLGAEKAAHLVREFAGQSIRFPITDHYDPTKRDCFGFPVLAPVLGADYEHILKASKTVSLPSAPLDLSHQATAFYEATPQVLDRQPGCSSQALPPHIKQLESARSIAPLATESLQPDLSGS